MSHLLGLVSPSPVEPNGLLERVLRSMPVESMGRQESIAVPKAALAVQRADWELGTDFSDGAMVVREGNLAIVADASLYYRTDLTQRLAKAGVTVRASTPSHLILGAYRAWGVECATHLEGDFAFILWDADERRLHAARDFSGRRPLYYTRAGDTLVIASSIGAIRTVPGCSTALNLTYLGELASATVATDGETCYRAISALAPGTSLSHRPGGNIDIARHWDPPLGERPSAVDLESGALELRELLVGAVAERLPRTSPAALSLSGGWDSTAVFGVAQEVIHCRRSGDLRPVSVSYPQGDTGREDDFILQTTARWNTEPFWLQIEDIPLFRETQVRAAQRDEPFAHPFEQVNRALAGAGRTLGARIMFDGYGGDQLFIASPGFLADLWREGRWREFLRHRRQVIARYDLATQLRYILLPTLPAWLIDLITELQGGRPLRGHFQRLPAPWIRRDFSKQQDLMGRQHRLFPPGQSHVSSAELHYYLTAPIASSSVLAVSRYSLDAGMEQRSPLFDQRVIQFAASRPWNERNLAGESKRTLRQAVQGLVPDSVLAPRRHKTGTAGQYFGRIMQRDFPALARVAFAEPILPELGIVDISQLRRATADLEAGRSDAETVSQLFFTLQTEFWLQARLATGRS